jgi:hypothetical protein
MKKRAGEYSVRGGRPLRLPFGVFEDFLNPAGAEARRSTRIGRKCVGEQRTRLTFFSIT